MKINSVTIEFYTMSTNNDNGHVVRLRYIALSAYRSNTYMYLDVNSSNTTNSKHMRPAHALKRTDTQTVKLTKLSTVSDHLHGVFYLSSV